MFEGEVSHKWGKHRRIPRRIMFAEVMYLLDPDSCLRSDKAEQEDLHERPRKVSRTAIQMSTCKTIRGVLRACPSTPCNKVFLLDFILCGHTHVTLGSGARILSCRWRVSGVLTWRKKPLKSNTFFFSRLTAPFSVLSSLCEDVELRLPRRYNPFSRLTLPSS